MNPCDIYITECDLTRLRDVLQARINARVRDRHHLERLQDELDRAHVMDQASIPGDVVTMNSRVRIEDADTGEQNVYTVVFPSDASVAEKKISVLAPIGTALLGSRAGGTVDWPVPAGMRTMRIQEVLYQPEAAGDYHL